eukprot:s233_g4.t2
MELAWVVDCWHPFSGLRPVLLSAMVEKERPGNPSAKKKQGDKNSRQRFRQGASKRDTFPWINSQIITVSESGNLMELATTIEAYVSQMNLVNISTAFHRIARLWTTSEDQEAAMTVKGVVQALIHQANTVLARASASGTKPSAQALANITWAMVTLNAMDENLLQVLLKARKGSEPRQIASTKEFPNSFCRLTPEAMALGSWAPFLALALAAAQPQLEDRLRAAMAKDKYDMGLAAAFHSSNLSFSVASGYTDAGLGLGQKTRLAVPEDLYVWGSTTKMITAPAVLQLVEQGLVKLTDPINLHIDPILLQLNGTRLEDHFGSPIRDVEIQHLLHMTSGIQDYDGEAFSAAQFANRSKAFGPVEILSRFVSPTLQFSPGERQSYCSTNYILLGFVLATHHHRAGTAWSWQDYDQASVVPTALQKDFTQSLFVKHGPCSQYTPVHGFMGFYPSAQLPKQDVWNVSCLGGWTAGDYVGSVADIARFTYDLYNTKDPKIVTAQSQAHLTNFTAPGMSSFKFYGMGTFNLAWSIGDADAYGHVGDTYGYQSQTTYIPGFDFVISVATNVETAKQAQPADFTCHAYHELKAVLTGTAAPRCTFIVPQRFIGKCVCLGESESEAIATPAQGQVRNFKPFELSTILWSYAKLSTLNPDACSCARPLFEAAASCVPGLLEVTNRPNGAEIFHREREACVELAGRLSPGIVEKLQNLPFRANTKGMHGGALDKIIAELKAGGPHRPEAFVDAARHPDPPPHDPGAGKRKQPKAAAKCQAKGKAQPRPRGAQKAEAKPEAVSADPPAAPAAQARISAASGEAKQAGLSNYFKSKAVDTVATASAAPPEAPDMAAAGIDLGCYYQELELQPGASLRAINSAYRKRALQTHPDKGGSSASFGRVQAAYAALTDSLRKAEEETSLTECSDRLFAALLLRGECPTDELKLYKIEVLRKFKSKLQAMSKQSAVAYEGELDESNSKGLSRQRTGFSVDVSWRSFRMRATHIPTLEQALAIHVAAVTTRQRALARFTKYLERRRATGETGKTAEEVHPLERQELEALMAEAPWTFQFASDVHGKIRVMSPWTPCLASAMEFRGLTYAAIGVAKEKPRNMTRIAALKKQMAKQAAQHREDAPRARAALLEAIDQCIEAEPERTEAIPQQTKAIEEPQSPNARAEVSSFVEFPVELDEQSAKAALQSNTEATPGITEATQLASRLRFEMLQAPWLSDRLRIFNLLNNALGVSLLAVGWVCSEVGLVLGLALYAGSNFLNRYTLHLIYRSCQLAKVKVSYPDVGQWCFGPAGFSVIATFMTIQMCCSCTAYAVTVADVLADTFEWQQERKKAAAVGFLLLVPFTFIRSLKRIAVLSSVATFACVIQMLAIAIPCYADVLKGREPGKLLYYTLDVSKLIKVLPVILLAYSTQASSPIILASMQDNSWENVRRVTGFVYFLLYVISAIFGHSVYLRYSDLCTNSALTTIGAVHSAVDCRALWAPEGQRPVDQVARWCLGCTFSLCIEQNVINVFISYIFMMFPVRNVLMSACLRKDELRHEAPYAVFAALSVGLSLFLSMLSVVAQALGGLEYCLRFGGGCCATLMAMVFPPLLFVRTRAERGWDARNGLLTRQLTKLYEENAKMKVRQEKLRLDLERSEEKNASLTDTNSDLAREICKVQNTARAAEYRHEAERQGNLRLAKSMQAEKQKEEALRTERWKGHGFHLESAWSFQSIWPSGSAVAVGMEHAEFTLRCLVTIVWSYATFRQKEEALFQSIGDHLISQVHTANCGELANTAWAYGLLQIQHERLFQELARRATVRLQDFKQQEVAGIMWGFAANNFFQAAFFNNASLAAQRLVLTPQQLTNILWALTRRKCRQSSLQSAVMALLPAATRQLDRFSMPEIAICSLAAAKVAKNMEGSGKGGGPKISNAVDFCTAAMQQDMNGLTVKSTGQGHASISRGVAEEGASFGAGGTAGQGSASSGTPSSGKQKEIRRSNLMTKIAKPEKKQNLALCLDGNKAYEKVSQALGLTFVKVDHVSHSAKEFHRKNGPNEAESGTLSIDAKWKSLCHFLGGGVRAKTKKWARNLWLGVLTFAWLHRHNLKQRSAETLRASFCKGCTVLSAFKPIGVRVDALPSGVSGVAASVAAKNGGHEPKQKIPSKVRIAKRTYRRALKRAAVDGFAWYRGRYISVRREFVPRDPVVRPPPDFSNRLGLLSWNCSGLSAELKAELFHWLRQQSHIGAFLLQETHWSFSNEWRDSGWFLFHSADKKPKQGGVLTAIRASWVDEHTLSWKEVIPGHLTQVRCTFVKQQVDLINIYQHAWSSKTSEQTQELLTRRSRIWGALDGLLRSLPVRSEILLAGDFNTVLEPRTAVSGHGIFPGNSATVFQTDRARLLDILQCHRLTVLNTWSRKAYTYKHPQGCSQIDYVVARHALADALAKKCAPIPTPLAGWRSAGHELLFASVPLRWRPWTGRGVKIFASEPKHSSLPVQLTQASTLEGLQGCMYRDHNILADRVQRPAMPDMDGVITHFWALRKALSCLPAIPVACSRRLLACCFARIRAHRELERQHRELRRAARQRKRQQVLCTLQLAESAAAQGDVRQVYQYVRQLSTKRFSSKIRFRDEQGGLLSREQECMLMVAYAQQLFTGRHFALPQMEPLPGHYFDSALWVEALHQLRSHKAVPCTSASVQGWKSKAPIVAPMLARLAKDAMCCDNPAVPMPWSQVQLAWLAKANKCPSCPRNLRTIGLMTPDTKAFLILLKRQAEPFVQDSLSGIPQYAYRAGASTADAILRGSSHCRRIRQVLKNATLDHTARVLQQAESQLVGGLMCGLDLTQAFDRLEYSEMHQALAATGMPAALATAIVTVHMQTVLHIRHGKSTGEVTMSRGLRQGCPIAPLVYTAWVIRFCRLVDAHFQFRWASRHMSIYADDKHCFWEITDPNSLRKAIAALRILLDVLRSSGMEVSINKCVAVLALRGVTAQQALKRHVKHWNGHRCLVVPGPQGDDYIPLAEYMSYLGVQLSYGAFEAQTAQARFHKAAQNFAALRQVLRTRGPLSLRQRQRIYNACIIPSLLYGLVSVGVTTQVLQRISSIQAQHMRKLHRVHEHGVSNEAVLERAGLCPRLQLVTRAQQQLRLVQQDTRRAGFLRELELQQALVLHSEIEQLVQLKVSCSLTPLNAGHIRAVSCPVCGLYFDSDRSLHKHIQAKHSEINRAARIHFSRANHALFGLPFCRFCRVRCGDWHALEKHATQGMCMRLKQGFAANLTLDQILAEVIEEEKLNPPVPPADYIGPQRAEAFTQHAFFTAPLAEVPRHAEYIRHLATVCALCGQRLRQASKIKPHWQRQHATAWDLTKSDAASTARSLLATFRTPCQFCGSMAKNIRQHVDKCSAFFQVAAVRHLLRLGKLNSSVVGYKAPALKPHETQPAYQNFALCSTPLGKAFAGANRVKGMVTVDPPGNSVSLPQRSGILQAPMQGRVGGQVPSIFSVPRPPRVRDSLPVEALWTCRLRLHNPHALCYMNATLIALMHGLLEHNHEWSGLQFLRQAGRDAVEQSVRLSLSRMPRFVRLCQRWGFQARQEDASEFLLNVLLPAGQLNTTWERRCLTPFGPRILEQGELPISLPVPEEDTTLQCVINTWFQQGDCNAIAYSDGLVVLHLLRFRHGRKLLVPVVVPDSVQLPLFADGISTVWCSFRVVSFVVHEGPHLHQGHYRAMPRVRDSWAFQDDGVPAVPSPITAAHNRNVYLVWVARARE